MPSALPTKRCAAAAPESLLLKAALVVSTLVLASFLLAAQEFYFSAPAHSLSETEAALRLAASAPAMRSDAPSQGTFTAENR